MKAEFFVVDPSGDVTAFESLSRAVEQVEATDADRTIVFDKLGQLYPLRVIARTRKLLGLIPISVNCVEVQGPPIVSPAQIVEAIIPFARSVGISDMQNFGFEELLGVIVLKLGGGHVA
jgi:hypothetical protein